MHTQKSISIIISRQELEFADASGQPEGPPLESPGIYEGAAQFLTHCHRKEFQSESKWNKVGGFVTQKDKTHLKSQAEALGEVNRY